MSSNVRSYEPASELGRRNKGAAAVYHYIERIDVIMSSHESQANKLFIITHDIGLSFHILSL